MLAGRLVLVRTQVISVYRRSAAPVKLVVVTYMTVNIVSRLSIAVVIVVLPVLTIVASVLINIVSTIVVVVPVWIIVVPV